MLKRQITPFIAFIAVGFLYQNCGQTPFGPLSLSSQVESSDSSSSTLTEEEKRVSNPYALLSSEQVLKSMSSVTGTAISGGLANEYNNRQAVLGTGYDLKLITSPMLISITNLASSFCNETLNREINLPADQRKFFGQIDFTKPVINITDAAFESSVQSMSLAFWGRSPNEQEKPILVEGKSDFVSALTDAESKATASSKNLMLYMCTAMLSSFDTLSF